MVVLDRWLGGQHLRTDPIIDCSLQGRLLAVDASALDTPGGRIGPKASHQRLRRSFDPDRAVEMLARQRNVVELLNVRTDILHRWYTIRGFKDLETVELFHALYPSLAFRTTSVLNDEPLYLATLFRLPVAATAQQRTHEERMVKFWSTFTELPAEIMDHYEPRLQISGFRWAPRSFMSDDESPVLVQPPDDAARPLAPSYPN